MSGVSGIGAFGRRGAERKTTAPSQNKSRETIPVISEDRIPAQVGPAEVYAHFNQEVYEALLNASLRSREILGRWRSNRGKFGYAYLNVLRMATDDVVNLVLLDRYEEAEAIERVLTDMYRQVEGGRLPPNLAEYLPYPDAFLVDDWFMQKVRRSFMTEIYEIRLVRMLWPVIRWAKPVPEIPSPGNAGVSLQAWFQALSDAISELSKMVVVLVEREKPSLNDQIVLEENYLGVARALLERRNHDQSEATAVFGSKQWNGTSKWSRRVIGYHEGRLRQLTDYLFLRKSEETTN